MKKIYAIISRHTGTNEPAGVFSYDEDLKYPTARPATPDEARLIDAHPQVDDRMLRGEFPLVFDLRKDARAAAVALNDEGWWRWQVIEIGAPAERDMRPVLGWQIWYEDILSCLNSTEYGANYMEGWGSYSALAAYAFPTREAARRALKSLAKRGGCLLGYTIKPVYGAYRMDCRIVADDREVVWHPGSLRFRTKAAAEKWGSQFGKDVHRLTLHTMPVPEEQLYVPL